MPRTQQTSSRSTSYSKPYTSYKIPASFSHTAPILPVANHKFQIPATPSQQTVEVKRTLGQSIKDGFGFGIGSSIAQRLFGPSHVSQTIKPVTPVVSSEITNKLSHEDCLKEYYDSQKRLYETCLLTKSHQECHQFSPFHDIDHSEQPEEKKSYSKCMQTMYLECKKINSNESCKKYLV
jgi:hypothetical protein